MAMEIKILEPYGYCLGVNHILENLHKIKKENPDKEIILFKSPIHNEGLTKDLMDEGFVFLDPSKEEEEDALKQINPDSIVLFGAHGHNQKLDEIAKEKGLVAYDLVCPFVKANEIRAKKALQEGREIIYIGKDNHAEADCLRSISKAHIHFVDINKPEMPFLSDKPLVLSQTSISREVIEPIAAKIKEANPDCEFVLGPCTPLKERFSNLEDCPFEPDLIVVVGSKTSSNSSELFNLSKAKYPDASIYMALDADDLREQSNGGIRGSIALIMSATSASKEQVLSVSDYIKSI